MYDYGERQTRADYIIGRFRANPCLRYKHGGREYNNEELATEVEQGTDFGRTLVAVAGFVLAAFASPRPPRCGDIDPNHSENYCLLNKHHDGDHCDDFNNKWGSR